MNASGATATAHMRLSRRLIGFLVLLLPFLGFSDTANAENLPLDKDVVLGEEVEVPQGQLGRDAQAAIGKNGDSIYPPDLEVRDHAVAVKEPSTRCSEGDREYADHWDNYYDPEYAHQFGLQIQEIIRRGNSAELMQLVNGELKTGPRRGFVLSKKFQEIFPADWVQRVLSDSPPCSPIGWRGFMLGAGAIWYSVGQHEANIVALNGVAEEKIEGGTWDVDLARISPSCLTFPSSRGDNFAEIAEHNDIAERSEFLTYPGQFLGNPITDFSEFEPEWCSPECGGAPLAIGYHTDECAAAGKTLKLTTDRVVELSKKEDDEVCRVSYQVIMTISPQACNALAPKFSYQCVSARLLEVQSTCGGGMGTDQAVGVFGVFQTPSNRSVVLPLRFFDTLNSARDDLSASWR